MLCLKQSGPPQASASHLDLRWYLISSVFVSAAQDESLEEQIEK